MVQGPSTALIAAIRDPPSVQAQIDTLKQLKNDIIGHDQRKELVVKQGIIQPLVDILASARNPELAAGKRRAAESNGASLQPSPTNWSLEDEARLQATLILGLLAAGGRAFVPPLLAADAQKRLLDLLAAPVPPRLITAALQALRSLATSARCDSDPTDSIPLDLHGLGGGAQSPFPALLHPCADASASQRTKLTIEIVTATAITEAARTQLAASDLLEDLAALLASHAIDQGHVRYRGSSAHFPTPPPKSTISSILSAITAIVTGSTFRVQAFLLCRPIRELFTNGMFNDSLLPQIYVPTSKSVTFTNRSYAFPALKSLQQTGGRQPEAGIRLNMQTADLDHANAVCRWLMYVARSMQGVHRLPPLRLLALINNAIEAGSEFSSPRSELLQRARERERQLSLLAVPIAVQLIEAASEAWTADSMFKEDEIGELKAQACAVLALLIKDNRQLQQSAVEAGAIKRVCPLLKKSFDNVQASKPMWTSKSGPPDHTHVPDSCKMGSRGLPHEIAHVMCCRQGALEALAALAKKEDIHRKAIIDAGVVQSIIDSLKPFGPTPLTTPKAPITPKDGNTKPVLLAACDAVQSMSRSVSLLRTSLIDAGVAKPIFQLVQNHQDLDVKIAATDVLCNLLLDFSPMKDDLIAEGAAKVLCEHTRQSEMGLRLSSLWALKHLILRGSKELKIQCLEELGTGWLVNAIQGEHNSHIPLSTGGVSVSTGLSAPNAAGEQVNLLNPASMDLDNPLGDVDEDEDLDDEDEDEDGEVMFDEGSGTHYQSSQLRSTLHQPVNRISSPFLGAEKYLASLREMEQDPSLVAKRMDVAVQEQALDFIRNLLNGDDCAAMVEHLLQQVGSEKLFSLLTEKLAPISAAPPSTSASNGTSTAGQQQQHQPQETRPLYHPTPLILSTIHVLTHLANAAPRHKSLLIAQTPLLRAWLPHFTHPDRRVRVMSVWAVNSLTWVEDDADRDDARRRAQELRAVGISRAVRDLSDDADLDVRERVKTAVRQMDGL